ncbi:MAG: replicative DNA helicase, partial [Bdellovibrionota bacterium]
MLGGEEGRGPEQGQELPPWRNRSSSGDRGGPGGRIPPHNIEAERSVLGAILINNTSLSYVLDTGLESRDFYTQAHQKIFECEMALSERGEPVDMITLQSALRDRGWYEVVGGTEALTKLFEDTFAVGNITKYAKIVREKAILRRVIECAGEIGAGAFEPIEDTEEFLDEAERKMLSVADTKLTKTFSSIKDVLVKNIETIEMLSQRKSEVVGLPTGFHDFDRLTSGLRGGQLVIIAARPAMGKTSLFLSAVQNISLTGPNVCALFSLEMSDEELVTRLLAGAAKIDSRRLKTGRLADRDWQRLAGAADQLSQAKIFIDDSGDLTVMDIRARCRRLLTVEKRLDLIVVDYL